MLLPILGLHSIERASGFGLFGSGSWASLGGEGNNAFGSDNGPESRSISSPKEKKLAQLASDAFSASRPRRSQLLRRRTFHAGSDVGEEGPWCRMVRQKACCACCRANMSRAGS